MAAACVLLVVSWHKSLTGLCVRPLVCYVDSEFQMSIMYGPSIDYANVVVVPMLLFNDLVP